jgi:hypothetical protein
MVSERYNYLPVVHFHFLRLIMVIHSAAFWCIFYSLCPFRYASSVQTYRSHVPFNFFVTPVVIFLSIALPALCMLELFDVIFFHHEFMTNRTKSRPSEKTKVIITRSMIRFDFTPLLLGFWLWICCFLEIHVVMHVSTTVSP